MNMNVFIVCTVFFLFLLGFSSIVLRNLGSSSHLIFNSC